MDDVQMTPDEEPVGSLLKKASDRIGAWAKESRPPTDDEQLIAGLALHLRRYVERVESGPRWHP